MKNTRLQFEQLEDRNMLASYWTPQLKAQILASRSHAMSSASNPPPPLPSGTSTVPPGSTITVGSGGTTITVPQVQPKPVGFQSFYNNVTRDPQAKSLGSKQAYYRYDWASLEPDTPGIYNWSAIDRDYAAAMAAGQQFNFRIMPYEDEGGGPVSYRNTGYVGTSFAFKGAPTFQPNLNDSRVLGALKNFIAQLGTRYSAGTATVDLGWWGSYGEQNTYGITGTTPPRPTAATQVVIVNAIRAAFPKSYVIVPCGVWDDQLTFTTLKGMNVGWRFDSWGDWSVNGAWAHQNNYYPQIITALGNTWQTCPIILEPANVPDKTQGMQGWLDGGLPWQSSFNWAMTQAHAWAFSNKGMAIPASMLSSVNALIAYEQTL